MTASAVTGGAFDAVTYQSRTAPVRVTLEESGDPNFAASNDGENGEGDRVAPDIEIVRGGSGADQLFGNSQRNELHGGAGSDAIDGGANNDTLYGDDGSDQITGGPGNDTIVGGPGDDIINARDGEADSISCGDGADRANVDEFDTVAPDCFEGGGGGAGPGGGTGPGAATPPSAQPPGFATPPPSPSAEAGCVGKVTLGPVTALGVCFKKDGAKFVANAGSVGTTVRINGIDVALGSGAKLVLDPQGQSISATGSVQVKVGPIVLLSGAFDWNLKLSPLEFQAGGDTMIAGLPISGKISVKFGGGADLKLSVKLPAIFGGFTGDAAIHVDNALGITLGGLHIAVDHGFLGALEIKNLLLDYQADTKDWKGAVDILIPTPGRPEIKGSIEIDRGRLVSATVSGAGLDLPLAPALALQSLDAAVNTTPYFSLSGSIGLTAGPKIGNFAALRSSGSFFYRQGGGHPPEPARPVQAPRGGDRGGRQDRDRQRHHGRRPSRLQPGTHRRQHLGADRQPHARRGGQRKRLGHSRRVQPRRVGQGLRTRPPAQRHRGPVVEGTSPAAPRSDRSAAASAGSGASRSRPSRAATSVRTSRPRKVPAPRRPVTPSGSRRTRAGCRSRSTATGRRPRSRSPDPAASASPRRPTPPRRARPR